MTFIVKQGLLGTKPGQTTGPTNQGFVTEHKHSHRHTQTKTHISAILWINIVIQHQTLRDTKNTFNTIDIFFFHNLLSIIFLQRLNSISIT